MSQMRLDSSPTEAAEYLLRQGRPNAPQAQICRVASSVVADPHYRSELARDARTRLTEDVDIAMSILARSDRQRERDATRADA